MTDADRPRSEADFASLEKELRRNPADHVARHNFALELRRLDRPAEALAHIETAIAGGLRPPQTLTARAHLLVDLGRFDEAVDQYRQILGHHPGLVEVHEMLARLLPQIGRASEALDQYRAALGELPRSGLLWVSALNMAQALLEYRQLLDWAREATALFGNDTMLSVFEATALSALSEGQAARDLLVKAIEADPLYSPAYGALAYILLKNHDPAGAASAAQEATRRTPDDQAAWALLGTSWRLLDDDREHWLARYDELVMAIDLVGLDLAALESSLARHHVLTHQPAEQSLRGGTQTLGQLFDRCDPAIADLVLAVRSGVEERLMRLPVDPEHPFLRRNRGSIAFSGSWSVRLGGKGFHINHIHPSGWLSSACYIAVPSEIDGSSLAGALTLGVPDAALGLDLEPRRTIIPRPAMLVIFPSFIWHGTLPFESRSPRLTVAFDALPSE